MAEMGLFDQVYNPDVLSCLANLSNDEVFTPPEVANAMLDMLSLISGNTNTGGWNQTHPSPADRIKNVNKKLSGIKFKGKDKAVRQKRFAEMTSDL